ncbi:MAG: hypothetical protein CMP48_03990 [Rickettsiales bacterium]|nr:hypothetical protein [Rickettsiales bacterium]
MNRLKTLLSLSLTLVVLISVAQETRPEGNDGTGFFAKNGKIYDPDGEEFIPLGFNAATFWAPAVGDCKQANMYTKVPQSGANAVRIVSQVDGSFGWNSNPTTQRELIDSAISNQLVPMLEMHNATCGEPLQPIIDYWESETMVEMAKDFEKYLWLNIANEHNFDSPEEWRDTYIDIITSLRSKGVKNLIVLDAGDRCGQDPEAPLTYGKAVLDADPQKNVVFSIHMYGFWRSEDRSFTDWTPPFLVEEELPKLKETGISLIVGEFALDDEAAGEGGPNYTADSVLAVCQRNGIGWYAWSFFDSQEAYYYSMVDDVCGDLSEENRTIAGKYFIPYLQEHASIPELMGSFLRVSDPQITVPRNNGSGSFFIQTNGDWTVETEDAWIEIATPNGTKNAKVQISTQNTDEDRSGTITIRTNTEVFDVEINQANVLNVNPTSIETPSFAGSKTIEIESNGDWTVSTEEPWVSISKTSGSLNDTFTISYEANTGVERNGIISVQMSENDKKTIEITQEAPSGALTETIRFEGEDFSANNGGGSDNALAGFTGEGYFDSGGNGSWVEWTVTTLGGDYELFFQYANGQEDVNRQCALSVNGASLGNIPFSPSGSWETWIATAIIEIELNEGENSIRLTAADAGGPNLDFGEITGGPAEEEVVLNAENNNISIFPNPFTGTIAIQNYKGSYEIRAISGQILAKGNIEKQLNLSYLKPGLYFINLEEKTFKIIKN